MINCRQQWAFTDDTLKVLQPSDRQHFIKISQRSRPQSVHCKLCLLSSNARIFALSTRKLVDDNATGRYNILQLREHVCDGVFLSGFMTGADRFFRVSDGWGRESTEFICPRRDFNSTEGWFHLARVRIQFSVGERLASLDSAAALCCSTWQATRFGSASICA